MFESLSENIDEISNSRENKTEDIAKRISVITANRIHLKRYPIDNPVTAFNPSLLIRGQDVSIYARIVLGYYTYSSAVAEIKLSLDDLFQNSVSHYTAEIVVYPDNKFDIWGTEDPRVYEIDGIIHMTYCGRTVLYFDPHIRVERTIPITAILDRNKWNKTYICRFPESLRDFVISDKNAFFVKVKSDLKLFHRPHMKDEKFYLVVSDIEKEERFTIIRNTKLVLKPAKFEEKIGWGTPAVRVDKEYLFLLHGVDRETLAYRVFAMTMDEDLNVTAITPYYIMEPKEVYEMYGDRPFVVFPCGAQILDDSLIISYGAADSTIGIGEIDLSELMSILDKNRFK